MPVNTNIGRDFSSRFNIIGACEKIANQVRKTIAYDRIAITILDFEQDTFRNIFVSGLALDGSEQGDVFALPDSFVSEVANSRRAVRLDRSMEYPDQEQLSGPVLVSHVATPLISNNEVIWTLHLASVKPDTYGEQDLINLETIGEQIAGTTYNSALLQAEQDRTSQLEALYRVAAILAQPQTFGAKAQAIVETLVRIADADQAIVRRADENGDDLHLVATGGSGVIRFAPTLSISDQHSASSVAFHQGRTLLINDYQKSPYAMAAMQSQGVASVLVMPIRSRGRVLGVLCVTSKTASHFNNGRVALLTAFADEIGIVFDTAELTDNLRASREEMATVDEIARIITDTLEIEEVYDQFAVAAKKLVEFDRVTIGVISHDEASITIKYSFGSVIPGHELGQVSLIDGNNYLAALLEGLPVFLDDLEMDARNSVDEDYQSSGLRSSAVVPLISKGRTIGSLGFRSTNPARYGPKEQAIIIRLANQIAPAVENAQLYAARVQAEEALQASAARCQAVMDTAPDGIITTDHIGCIETFNPAAEAIFGYSIDEVLGKNVSMLMPEPDGGAHSGYISRYLTTGEARVIGTGREEVGWRKDGTTFPMDLSIGVVEIGGHKIFTGIIRDITERKRTEARLNESIRLASVGELAAGVAHEINNPLAAIILASDFLSKSGLSGEKSADVKTICDAAQRAARIVQNMLVFAHKTDSKPERMKIDLVAKQALEWKTRDFRLNKIECKIIIETGLPACFIDRHQMGQVIINVLNNAEHALTHRAGGNITIDIRSTSGLVILEVRDDGPGIEPELVPKIFDPFFTTKAAGEGIGPGLSICYGIIQQHGGEMWAANNKGAGTSIFIQLPIAGDESICQPATPLLEKAASVSTTRLLVTDDEPAILDLITRGLRGDVDVIHQAESGEVALEMIRDSDYDCILLDLKMPGVSGMEVFDRIAASDRKLAERIIFMTGDTASHESAAFLAYRKNPVISKPFQLEQIKHMISSVVSPPHHP